MNILGPITLILLCPPFSLIVWYTHVFLDGSISALITNPSAALNISQFLLGSKTAWSILAIFVIAQLMLMRLLPGQLYQGPVTPKGNIPVYKANGVVSFLFTMTLFFICTVMLDWFSPAIIYDNLGEILGALNIVSLVVCGLLYFKGRFYPSSSDSGLSENPIFDFYWGTELYPRVFGFDIKMFTNCRFGLMGWALIIISFAAKQSELHGLSNGMVIAVGLQLIYIAKFFWWETGYLSSLDIMHDRAGFYICWGCLVWVPSIYTSSTLFMVNHPMHFSKPMAFLLFIAGTLMIFANYIADRQRQIVRLTDGACKIWGKKPELIRADYVTDLGERKQNLLLASGFWGISRHFHYVPEILAALCWTVPAGFGHILPYFYVGFLAILLTHRAIRDDHRCAKKYGHFWNKYCEFVPFKIIPGVY